MPAAALTASPSAGGSTRVPHLASLTALRGPAALFVVLYHLRLRTPWLEGVPVLESAFVGISMFFVLSGFVLMWSSRPHDTAKGFWVRRFARIYPSHLLVAVIALLVPITVFAPTVLGVAANLTLTQAFIPLYDVVFSLNGVSWSLSCEMAFYAVAPFLFRWAHRRSTRTVVLAMGSWWLGIALLGIVLGYASGLTNGLAYPNPVIRSGEFVLGALAALLLRRGWTPPKVLRPLPTAVFVVLVHVAVATFHVPPTAAEMMLGPCFALLSIAMARSDVEGRTTFLRAPVLQWAGDCSFALYLIHELVIINVMPLVGPVSSRAEGLAWAGAVLGLSILAAVAIHHLWEKPWQLAILGWWKRRHPRIPASPPPVVEAPPAVTDVATQPARPVVTASPATVIDAEPDTSPDAAPAPAPILGGSPPAAGTTRT